MTPLTPEAKKAISARVQFYRELGIHSFYRRSEAPVASPSSESATMAKSSSAASAAKAKPLPVIQQVSSEKSELLDAVRADIGDCTRCRLSKERTNIVFGTGNLDADIMFVGEGPGADEDEQGLPFVGRAGQLLINMISAMGIQREEVYIANVVKCRPPGNRTPESDE
ncbi:MAG: Uracil-DNA glycosylase, family 4, partial [Acidobacteriaceae bacterium]|nr:Uracil-DNA glycosylase, family 4 [Acidobacteriaceae bacterium]